MVRLPRRLRQDAKLSLLAANPAFAGCRPADLVALAATADLVPCERGELLAFQDDPRRRWWFVVDGRLEILWNWSWPSRIEKGQAFGADRSGPADRAGADDRSGSGWPDRATIVAAEPALVLVASRGGVLRLIDEYPSLAEAIRLASVDLVGQEFEQLLGRAGHDRPVPSDHDRPLDEHRVGG